MASISKHKSGGWLAAICVRGYRDAKTFPTKKRARDWATNREAELRETHPPLLGGPTRVSLAQMLYEYAHKYTAAKDGAVAELNRINRYLAPVGLPTLQLAETEDGAGHRIERRPEAPRALPSAFAAHRNARLARREATEALRDELAARRADRISPADIRDFIATMQADGLAASTIRNELALLSKRLAIPS